jgi:hypothetical protein
VPAFVSLHIYSQLQVINCIYSLPISSKIAERRATFGEKVVSLRDQPFQSIRDGRTSKTGRFWNGGPSGESSVTINGKLKEDVKVALNSNQVKSLQAGTYADGGGLYLVVRGDRVWAFRFTDLDGKRAQMEFSRVGDRDNATGDVRP